MNYALILLGCTFLYQEFQEIKPNDVIGSPLSVWESKDFEWIYGQSN